MVASGHRRLSGRYGRQKELFVFFAVELELGRMIYLVVKIWARNSHLSTGLGCATSEQSSLAKIHHGLVVPILWLQQ